MKRKNKLAITTRTTKDYVIVTKENKIIDKFRLKETAKYMKHFFEKQLYQKLYIKNIKDLKNEQTKSK